MANGGIWQTLMRQGFTPQQIQALMRLGVLEEEGGIISQEMQMADRLRERRSPQGRFSGNTFVSANPLEFVGTGIDRFRGELRAQQAIDQQRRNAEEKAKLRAQFLQMMGGGGAGAPMTPGTTPPIQPAPTPAPPGPAASIYPYGARPGTPTTGWR